MEESTKTIGYLYGLRAGLSYISQECDQIDEIENQICQNNSLIDKKNGSMNAHNSSAREHLIKCVSTAILVILTTALCVICCVAFNTAKNNDAGFRFFLGIGIGISALFSVIIFIIFLLNFISCIKNKIRARQAKIKIQQLEKEAELKAPVHAQNEAEIELWREQNLQPHIRNVNNMYTALKESFKLLLIERDWQNLDLVIYYLETRRADCIKEALQLVDKELHACQIENLIVCATETIVDTLTHGFATIQQPLGILYNGLSEQLSAVGAQVVNSQVMNKALLAKAYETSKALVNDMKKIRENSDYMRYSTK